ncbi:hypothetical protein [Acetobacterium bakii]|uniref:Uncharacterized protein n=1 Tax=Acetobacterium bakii TaxID=52689 RepID=A0A0L6U255_9FIRM|nr:hypothetical protein [Acetobacterium bakii]KNZ41855.1 hypothetical protein AKG39_09555 [Acetobacterium bakii]
MNYDTIIVELLSRVQSLETEMEYVKNEFALRFEEENEVIEDEVDDLEVFTRSQAREKAIEIITEKFPDYFAQKAKRNEGSGIKVSKSYTNRPLLIKFYHSKSFPDRSGNSEHGWHVVRIDEVLGNYVDLCMFSLVDLDGNWNYLIYDPNEIAMYNEDNRLNASNELHLYFSVQDGKAVEVREDTIDVTDHLNNWSIIERMDNGYRDE